MMRTHGRFVAQSVVLAFLVVIASWNGTVHAADEPIELTLAVFTVLVDEESGEEVLVPFEDEEGEPGTVIEYQLRVANVSDVALEDIILRLDVPAGTVYVDGSERLDRATMLLQFSIDEGQTFRTPPVRYTVQQEDGSLIQQIAGPEQYTNLRLVFLRALESGEEVIFTYRVEVE